MGYVGIMEKTISSARGRWAEDDELKAPGPPMVEDDGPQVPSFGFPHVRVPRGKLPWVGWIPTTLLSHDTKKWPLMQYS